MHRLLRLIGQFEQAEGQMWLQAQEAHVLGLRAGEHRDQLLPALEALWRGAGPAQSAQ